MSVAGPNRSTIATHKFRRLLGDEQTKIERPSNDADDLAEGLEHHLLRQPRLAQAVEEVLGVLGALEGAQSRLRAVNRPFGLDPQDLGGLCPSLFDVSQLGIGRGEPVVAGAQIRRPGSAFPQQGQRLANTA